MRVLHVYRTYFPDTQGGLEEVIRQVARNTLSSGVEARVYTLSRKPQPAIVVHEGVEVHRVQLSVEIASCSIAITGLRSFEELADWADVIHYHFPWPFADVLHLLSRQSKPAVVTYHSDIVRQATLKRVYKPLMHRFLSRMDAIVCTSPNYLATSDVLHRYRKVEVIPIGISESSYPSLDQETLESVERQHGRDFFLFVGVLRYYKGLHILLDAIRDAPYRVVIAGAGPAERELKAQTASLGLNNVEFVGFVDDRVKIALFQLAFGVVFPSYLRSEAFGVTLLEGAMFAKPLISTEVGSGTSHVNVHGHTGLVVPPASSSALRQAMDELWQDRVRATGMGVHARERFEQLFTGELMGRRYMELYSRMLDQPEPARATKRRA